MDMERTNTSHRLGLRAASSHTASCLQHRNHGNFSFSLNKTYKMANSPLFLLNITHVLCKTENQSFCRLILKDMGLVVSSTHLFVNLTTAVTRDMPSLVYFAEHFGWHDGDTNYDTGIPCYPGTAGPNASDRCHMVISNYTQCITFLPFLNKE